MIDIKIAAQMAGTTDYRTDEPLDRPPTIEERALAVEIGYEIAAKHAIDLAAHVAGQYAAEQRYAEEIGIK